MWKKKVEKIHFEDYKYSSRQICLINVALALPAFSTKIRQILPRIIIISNSMSILLLNLTLLYGKRNMCAFASLMMNSWDKYAINEPRVFVYVWTDQHLFFVMYRYPCQIVCAFFSLFISSPNRLFLEINIDGMTWK